MELAGRIAQQMDKKSKQQAETIISELLSKKTVTSDVVIKVLRRYPKSDGSLFSKTELLQVYREMNDGKNENDLPSRSLLKALQTKPTRTLSGVAPITVLTKPFPCPGKCIFCPSDVRMPKSYLRDEPGAQRAERNWFDPYLQTYHRLQALHTIGHSVEKAEIIVLGGTWSFYPESYQIWFITRCFQAMNDFSVGKNQSLLIIEHYETMAQQKVASDHFASSSDPDENQAATMQFQLDGLIKNKTYNQIVSELYVAPEKHLGLDKWQVSTWEELEAEHLINGTAKVRCVGLVVETRPDNISEEEVIRIRRLGCTKVQIGVQSLQDEVLKLNHRGHDVAATRRAFKLLRQAGFKIHAHWMPNLYGSDVEKDKADFLKLFTDPDFMPDELKIYPCSLIESAELMQYYQSGKWRPYTRDELLDVLTFCLTHTPPYCRLTRVIRDIPSTDIVEGNKITNFRELVQKQIADTGGKMQDIRAREIRGSAFDESTIKLEKIEYDTSVSQEIFLQYVANETNTGLPKLLGFLRLSLPTLKPYIDEIHNAAIIREVHVYGEVVDIGTRSSNKPQHLGLGKKLIAEAKKISHDTGYKNLAVISAVGTRGYYENQMIYLEKLFQLHKLT